MHSLDEWGLGGRGFGTWITWFLLGGDLYTAYTFVAVPAAMFATGAVSGFFAVPYTIVVYPIIFVFMARLWSVSHSHGFVTPADFVKGRYGSRGLSLAVAVTGILATMPYIALQLVGIQAVLEVLGLGGTGNKLAQDLPLLIAFAVLAAYTYSSGLRAPAAIAFVKDGLIYLVILVAIIYLPSRVGGWHHVFDAAGQKFAKISPATGKHFGSSVGPIDLIGQSGYIALTAFVINVVVAAVLTAVLRALKAPEGDDVTRPEDYRADEGDARVRDLPELTVGG
jgi:SSS family solute:Na+ symporter